MKGVAIGCKASGSVVQIVEHNREAQQGARAVGGVGQTRELSRVDFLSLQHETLLNLSTIQIHHCGIDYDKDKAEFN